MAEGRNRDRRGFASMESEKQRRVASAGGRAAHQRGSAHKFNPEEAREAGRKGCQQTSRNREHMAEIGRRGGGRARIGSVGRVSGEERQ